MKSGTRYLKLNCKMGLCLSLSFSLLLPVADAFPFFRKKPPAQELPPKAKIVPGMMNIEAQPSKPQIQPRSPQSKPLPEPATRPKDDPPPAYGAQLVDPLQAVTEKKVFSPALLVQTTPVTRSQLAEVMVKALEHDTKLVSEFPFYRDVPLNSAAYVPIEVAREKKLLEYTGDHGFYYPNKPVTYGELYLAISHAITGAPPVAERAEYLLRNIPERETLSPEQYDAVAKMAQSRFFGRTWRHQTRFEPVGEGVTPQGLAPFVSYMMFLNERRAPVGVVDEVVPQLPAGLKLVISPSTGILEERLKAGGRIRFQLVQAVETIPRGSMVRGIVQEASSGRTYRIIFNSIRTTEGQVYETRAELSVSFSSKDKLGFIVPGETFEILTEPVTVTTEPLPEAAPQAAPQAAPPPLLPPDKNVPNSKILRQPAKTVPK